MLASTPDCSILFRCIDDHENFIAACLAGAGMLLRVYTVPRVYASRWKGNVSDCVSRSASWGLQSVPVSRRLSAISQWPRCPDCDESHASAGDITDTTDNPIAESRHDTNNSRRRSETCSCTIRTHGRFDGVLESVATASPRKSTCGTFCGF